MGFPMIFVKFFYTTFLLPPGIFILILGIFCITLFKKHRKPALVLTVFTLLLYLASTVGFANWLIRSLEQKYHPPEMVKGDMIIMLGGGATLDTPNLSGKGHLSGPAANRLLACIQLYHKLKVPIIVSGGQVYTNTGREADIARRILLDAGVPPDMILVEDKSRNTVENARYVKKILDRYNCYNPILVTSAFHMDRAVRAFTKVRVGVIPYPTDYHTNVRTRFTWRMLTPSAGALNNVSLAVKEYLGIIGGWY